MEIPANVKALYYVKAVRFVCVLQQRKAPTMDVLVDNKQTLTGGVRNDEMMD